MTERSKPLVVIADDDPMVRLLCEQSLTSAGFSVLSFSDGKSILEALPQLSADIVLLDVEMPPGADGFSVCQELRKQKSMEDIPIVMVTGNDDTDSINRAYDVGATDFIRKPIAWAVLPHRVRYILRAKAAFADLLYAERKTRALLQTIPDVMISIESSGVIRELVSSDPRYSDSCGSYAGKKLEAFFPSAVAKKIHEYTKLALAGEGVQIYEHALDGSGRHCETRLIAQDESCVLAIVRDITDRKESEEKIHQMAFYDDLTGLPNRQQLVRDLRHAIANAKSKAAWLAILFIDLDRFKRVNDTLGHYIGDKLLQAVAKRLESCVRASSTEAAREDSKRNSRVQLARVAGDEFVILIEGIKSEDEASAVAERAGEQLAAPFSFEGHQFVVTPSVGISLYPDDGDNVEDLLMSADAAMYRAKNAGRNNYQFYSHTMRSRSLERLDLETDLRSAINNDEFLLYYQPKVDIATWSVVGAEALLRWRHTERGWVSPGEFIPLAEETGLIVRLGEWVIEQACAQLKQWENTALDNVRIAVNVSGQQFSHGNVLDAALRIISEASIRPQYLELEITESLLMNDMQETVEILQAFRKAGLRLSVDDFGTGYSSLAYLKQFPLNALKIDQSFVQGLHENKDDAAICAAILAMARELGLKVVAEGVELDEHLEFLRRHGCDEIQGYLFSKPVPADQLEELIRHNQADSKQKISL